MRGNNVSSDLKSALIEGAESRPALRLEELVETVSERFHAGSHDVARSLYELLEEGQLRIEDPKPPENALVYVRSIHSAWLWLLLSLVALTAVSIYLCPQTTPYLYVRYAVGSLFVLYLPGYSLIEALYPQTEDLKPIERLALSIGLSLALVPLTGLVLNYTPCGIRLNPVFTSLSLLTVVLAFIAAARKFSYFRLGLRR